MHNSRATFTTFASAKLAIVARAELTIVSLCFQYLQDRFALTL